MLNEKKILIKDSCVLFDLLDLNLLNSFFQLNYHVLTTPQVVAEITDENQLNEVNKFILNENLIIDTNGSRESIELIIEKHPGLSFADGSVLELANREKGIILSSDKSLVNEAKRMNITVYGSLWIIEELINKNIIRKDFALDKLKLYPIINQRAPRKEITSLINKLEAMLFNQ